MSETKPKVRIIWLVVAAIPAFALGLFSVLAFRSCGKPAATCPPVNIDSIIAALPPDTILVPGPDNQVIKWFPSVIDLTDTAAVDSLLTALLDQKGYYTGLVDRLQQAIGRKDSALVDAQAKLELIMRTNVYEDSTRTDTYFHRWRIEAEGPIRAYTFGITPIFPPQVTCPPLRPHHIGFMFGGQAEGGTIRPVYSARYGYKFLTGQFGYLPSSQKLGTKTALQLSAGIEISFK